MFTMRVSTDVQKVADIDNTEITPVMSQEAGSSGAHNAVKAEDLEGLKCRGVQMRNAVEVAIILVFAYLCAGELLPPIFDLDIFEIIFQKWAQQQAVLLALISCLIVFLSCCSGSRRPPGGGTAKFFSNSLAILNLVPIVLAAVMTYDNHCDHHDGDDERERCDHLSILIDEVGLVAAKLYRLDLGILMLLSARGHSAWLLGATGGRLGYAEAVPLHVIAGWWCAAQAALHSVAYLVFYPYVGGWRSLWENCFPVPVPHGPNRLGFVNGMGVLAFVVLLALALPALPLLRRRYYHVFQLLHLPLSILWIVGSVLHDLPILLFALPGLADWFLCWCDGMRRCSATARLLPGTSGPWVQLTIQHGDFPPWAPRAPHGQWVSVRVLPLGRETHPLSVAALSESTTSAVATLTLVVSARAGNWSRALAALAQSEGNGFDVDVGGPFAHGGSCWLGRSGSREAATPREGQEASRPPEEDPLLLLVGGTGITGWLLPLASAAGAGRRCHLVWCVQKEADYQALASRLPRAGTVNSKVTVTVFVTQPSAAATGGGSAGSCEMLPSASSPPSVGDGVDQPLDVLPPDQDASVTVAGPSQARAGSLASVSLAATLAGLIMGWLWSNGPDLRAYVDEQHGPYRSLADWALIRRALPVVLIVAAAGLAMAWGSFVVQCAQSALKGVARSGYHELLLSPAIDPEPPVPAGLAAVDEVDSAHTHGHEMRSGRPDVDALVRETVGALASQQRLVVVAACGPAKLVEAAREAVVAARKGSRGVSVEFCGEISEW
jgi:hypothetical protein